MPFSNRAQNQIMLNRITIITFLIITLNGFSQSNSINKLDSITESYIAKLREKRIDTIAVYSTYATGVAPVTYATEDEMKDLCSAEYGILKSVYIFWKFNNQTFITKKDNCFDYKIIEIDAENLWIDYFKNVKTISNEKAKGFQVGNGFLMVDHSEYYSFKFITGKKVTTQNFDAFNFLPEEEYTKNPRKNLNYEFNQNLKSKIIMDKLIGLSKKNDYLLSKTKESRN
jgi:hypothetical protein